MAPQPVLDRIAKLLALSQSSNEHEAAIALERAQRLLAEHNMQMEDLQASPEGPEAPIMDEDAIIAGARLAKWRTALATVLGQHCGVFVYQSRRAGSVAVKVVGTPTDCAAFRAMYGWAEAAITRMSATACRGLGKSYAVSWCYGAVIGLRDTLHARERAQAHQPEVKHAGLVTMDHAKRARAFAEANMGKFSTRGSRPSGGNGFAAGRAAGASLGSASGSIGARSAIGMR